MLREKDLELIKKKGISKEIIEWQIEQFKKGSMPIKLVEPATTDKGITIIDDMERYAEIYKKSKKDAIKFVPASGAASRMFKSLFEFRGELVLNEDLDLDNYSSLKEFFTKIENFAFYEDLKNQLTQKGYSDISAIKSNYKVIIDSLLDNDGLAYGSLPKGLLKFHRYPKSNNRTPFEEHLVEAANYVANENVAKLHFTVSPEHLELFEKLKDSLIKKYSDIYKFNFDITFSIQKSATDTMAVTPDNKPFYDEKDEIFFRPGGHGALIENLNDIDSDIVFVKNIDNVIPEKRLEKTVLIKQALAGLLIEIQEKIFKLCHNLKNEPNQKTIEESKDFLKNVLFLSVDCFESGNRSNEDVLFDLLNRPVRVCGMVKNEGEPGGGPFIINDENGCESLQIIESSQIDVTDNQQESIFKASTHFNPVDLVCGVKNYKGDKFNLLDFVDKKTCFISKKSKDGRSLKALELPGLWNGAMAFWNTIFVEVPAETFNPVKTVNDLLREAHQ